MDCAPTRRPTADEVVARREAPTLIGLLGYLEAMTAEWGWRTVRSDRQALLGGANAVTISTWHAAKGREWPITILFGLETLREPAAFGLHVESDSAAFDLAAPLAGRWLRYWPNPYTTSNQGGPVKVAYEASAEFAAVVARSEREALRVLYVGWTRARDYLIFAAGSGKRHGGLIGTLSSLEPGLISEPPNTEAREVTVTWGGRQTGVAVHPMIGAAPVPRALEAGETSSVREPSTYPPARQLPSQAGPVACTLGTPVQLGPRIPLRGDPDMELVGRAVHDFLAADRPGLDAGARLALARDLLRRYRVEGHLEPSDIVAAATNLWAWTKRELDATRLHREWPVAQLLASGTTVGGTADLIARSRCGLAIIDHKTFPGSLEAALARLPTYAGQLAAYASAVAEATGEPIASTWIHLPVLGVAVELRTSP